MSQQAELVLLQELRRRLLEAGGARLPTTAQWTAELQIGRSHGHGPVLMFTRAAGVAAAAKTRMIAPGFVARWAWTERQNMNLPGFTAEASMYRSARIYRQALFTLLSTAVGCCRNFVGFAPSAYGTPTIMVCLRAPKFVVIRASRAATTRGVPGGM